MNPAGRRALAIASGGTVAVLVTVLSLSQVLRGPAAWVLCILAVLALPSSRSLSRRIALNLAIVAGVVPILWWTPWPADGAARSGVVCGILVGAVVCLAVWSPRTRALLPPRLRAVDAILPVVVVICGAIFAPFFAVTSGPISVAMLTQVTGGDAIGHFHVFEMIRRTGQAIVWSSPVGSSSTFAYSFYPEHFHSLAVFAAQLWGGAGVGSIDHESGLYGIGMSFAVSLGFLALVAAVISLRSLQRAPVLAVPAAAAVVSMMMLGFGVTLLGYGFPNFVFGISATGLGLLLAMDRRPTRLVPLIAIGATLVAAAHSWALLAPLAGIAFAFAVVRLPWRRLRARPRRAIAPVTVVLATGLATGYALVLVVLATGVAGSGTLELTGAVPTNPVLVTFACLVVLIVLGTILVLRARRRRAPSDDAIVGAVVVAFGLTAAALALGLIAVQLGQLSELRYYAYKLLDGVILLAGTVGVAALASFAAPLARRTPRSSTLVRTAVAGVVSLAFVLVPGVTGAPVSEFSSFVLPAATYTEGVDAVRSIDPRPTEDLIAAATVMSSHPCGRPFYLAAVDRPVALALENTRAMALSGTWTSDSQPISERLNAAATAKDSADQLLARLLGGHPGRCAVLAPGQRAALSPSTVERFDARLLSWDAAG